MFDVDGFDLIAECNRCLHCAQPRCKAACPVGNDLPRFLRSVSEGREQEAVKTIGHPFGEVCGYVCPHERGCQGGCVLSARKSPIAVGAVERAVFARNPYKIERVGRRAQGRKIAVVGGGVAGLTFAAKMYEQGADVTVYERDRLLSTLRLIPDFRLPREALSRIEEQFDGKIALVNKNVDATKFNELMRLYDVVYLSAGAQKIYSLGIDGEEFSTPYNVFLDLTSDFWSQNADLRSKKIAVIGGGNTAMDCARLAASKGARVTVAYRRTREDMPAFDKEKTAAENEGVKLVYNVAPVCIKKDERLLLTLARTENEGRSKLVVTDDTFTVRCDAVVCALGSGFDSEILGDFDGDLRHPFANVYAGGDVVGGKTAAEAVRDALEDARRATESFGR